MRVQCTDEIKKLCGQCATDQHLPQALRDAAGAASISNSIEWQDLKALTFVVRQQNDPNGPFLYKLCQGGGLSLPKPTPKPGKSSELQAHLDMLQRKLDQERYDKMVWEVIQPEREAAAAAEGGLHTYKAQMSYGMHVLAMMAAFYLFGHFAGRAITSNPVYHPAVGLVFMFIAMMLETVLYIIRTNRTFGPSAGLVAEPGTGTVPLKSPSETLLLKPEVPSSSPKGGVKLHNSTDKCGMASAPESSTSHIGGDKKNR